MPNNEIYDLIIVGGGPAGLTAGIYAMRAALKTVLIERGVFGGQVAITKEVENYPGIPEIGGFELCEKFLQHAKAYDLEILENFGKGVSYCATCDGFFFRGKTVAVIGGGDTALEDALYLAKITKKVYLVHRRDAFRGSRILQQRVLAEPKIEIVFDTVVSSIDADASGVTGLSLQNVKTGENRKVDLEGVFIFVGFAPNNQIVPAGIKRNTSGYVITDEKCETAIPGIFAVGDLRQKYANQIVLAAADGCTAALASAHYVETRKK